MLDREGIIAATKKPRRFEVVNCPSMGGDVKVWSLYAKERDAWERERKVKTKHGEETNYINFRASFLVHVLRNDDGSRMFSTSDIELLGNLPADDADHLFTVGMRINRVTPEDVEEMVKNSDATGGDDSPTV